VSDIVAVAQPSVISASVSGGSISASVSAASITASAGGGAGAQGPPGSPGPASSLSIGTVTSGTAAAAMITGDAPSQVLSLVLPRGAAGAAGSQGPAGAAGPANVLTIGTVSSGTAASATITGSSPSQVLSLVLQKGDQGSVGAQGPAGATGATGAAGPANVLTIGTVSSGTAASATITGSSPSQVLSLVLQKGDTGAAGTTAFSGLTGTPTTLAGYGITDAAVSSHTHGNLTNAGAIGSTADRIAVTTTSGVLTTAAIGSGLTLSGGTLTATGGGASLPDPYECGTFPLVSISAQPQAASVTAGGSATFSTTATATLPTSTISYQWQQSTDGGTTWANVSGATSSSLTLSSLTTGSNGYRYRCQLAASLSLVYTSSATLAVSSGNPFSAIPSGWTGSGTSASPVVPNANTSQQGTLTAGVSGTLRITGTVAVDSDDVPGVIQVAGVTVRTFTSAGTANPQSVNISQAITAGQVVTLTAWPLGISSGGYSGWGTNLKFWIA